jgi:outer membrane lipoprotein carrier protein
VIKPIVAAIFLFLSVGTSTRVFCAEDVSPSSAPIYELPVYSPSTAPLTVASILEKFKNYDARMMTLSADFSEVLDNGLTSSSQSVSGTFRYEKPNFFRMEEALPAPQTVVADGKDLWVWRPQTSQVIKTKISDWKKQDVMAQSFLSIGNYATMIEQYNVAIETTSAPDAAGYRYVALRMTPKKNQRGEDFTLRLNFSTRNFFPMLAEIDGEGMSLSSTLSHIRYNIPIPAETFEFTPPDGADVFDAFTTPKE